VKVHPAAQGTVEWQRARMGIPTASNFHRIVSPKTLKPVAAANTYLAELVAARLLGHPLDGGTTDFMVRGKELEAHAASAYALVHDVTPVEVGLCLTDDGAYGASPDRLIGDDGALEVKCLSAANHVMALMGLKDDEHAAQAMGVLLVTGRQWCDIVYSNPDLPSREVRVVRDEETCRLLHEAVTAFALSVAREERMLREEYDLPLPVA
jgi:exodeoxyribonuclease (lambda-induced)